MNNQFKPATTYPVKLVDGLKAEIEVWRREVAVMQDNYTELLKENERLRFKLVDLEIDNSR